MNNFNPGEGIVKVSTARPYRTNEWRLVEYAEGGEVATVWVREEPVPPLPTEPRTSIKVRYTEAEQDQRERTSEDWVLLDNGLQWMSDGCEFRTDDYIRSRITGFEVLAEPRTSLDRHRAESAGQVRRETAKAVLDRVQGGFSVRQAWIDSIAREFGVEVSS